MLRPVLLVCLLLLCLSPVPEFARSTTFQIYAGHRWENSLIGWTSSADSIEQATEAHLLFRSLEAAAAFCHRQGWAYDVAGEKATTKQRPKRFLGYGDNFRRAPTRSLN